MARHENEPDFKFGDRVSRISGGQKRGVVSRVFRSGADLARGPERVAGSAPVSEPCSDGAFCAPTPSGNQMRASHLALNHRREGHPFSRHSSSPRVVSLIPRESYLGPRIKSALKNLARNYGVHVRYMPRLISKAPCLRSCAAQRDVQPWNLDKAFIAAYSQIKDATLVDKYVASSSGGSSSSALN